MTATEIVAVIGGIGGVQGFIELIKWWQGRKVQDRHDIADVEATENENDRKQVDWLDKRLAERDEKIDAIYAELRAEQNAHLQDIYKLHEAELKLKEAEVKKCNKRGCGDRIPPSDY